MPRDNDAVVRVAGPCISDGRSNNLGRGLPVVREALFREAAVATVDAGGDLSDFEVRDAVDQRDGAAKGGDDGIDICVECHEAGCVADGILEAGGVSFG